MAQSKEAEESFSGGLTKSYSLLGLTITKSLQAGKVCNMGKLNQWSGNIVNHFWFCCRTCDGKSVKLKVVQGAFR